MSEKRPILFATDGSPSADRAQTMAFELAQRLDAPLLVVSVAHPAYPVTGYTAYGFAGALAEVNAAEQARVQELLASVAETAGAAGVRCTTVAADGFVLEEICRQAVEHDAQLMVVGSHGWGATRRLFSGSVSTGLVHSAPCPVLVVRSAPQAEEHAVAA